MYASRACRVGSRDTCPSFRLAGLGETCEAVIATAAGAELMVATRATVIDENFMAATTPEDVNYDCNGIRIERYNTLVRPSKGIS